MKKKLFLCLGLVITILVTSNLIFEWALNSTSRKFSNEIIRAKIDRKLTLAISTYSIPRLYRRQSDYQDLHAIILTLLYLDGSPSDAAWGIRESIKVINDGLTRYKTGSDEYYYLLQKKISIINRSPLKIDDWKKAQSELERLISFSTEKIGIHNNAYAYIEKMLFLANQGTPPADINSAYEQALEKLNPIAESNEKKLNLVKFSFYNGYAKCLLNDASGGEQMLAAILKLEKESNSFHEAMIANWDWPLVGNLLSPSSSGYKACNTFATQMKQRIRNI